MDHEVTQRGFRAYRFDGVGCRGQHVKAVESSIAFDDLTQPWLTVNDAGVPVRVVPVDSATEVDSLYGEGVQLYRAVPVDGAE